MTALLWNPYGAWSLFVGLVLWVLAALVLFTQPGRAQNRYLALALGTEPFLFAWGSGFMMLQDSAAVAYGLLRVTDFLVPVFAVAYLAFLTTLNVPGLRRIRGTTGTIALALLAFVGIIAYAVAFGGSVEGVRRSDTFTWSLIASSTGESIRTAFVVFFLFALVVTSWAWRRAPPGSAERDRGRYIFMSFAIRDAGAAFLIASDQLRILQPAIIEGAIPGVVLLMALILSYGILRHRLFDIDLKLKWTIRKSTLVAIFVGVFFISAQIAQAFLTTEYGWAIGGFVAGLLLLAISPLQRFAAHVADTAMPNVQDTEEYRTVRKGEVYQAAMEEILADGRITAKERRTLIRLQEQLGLDASTAQKIEVGVLDNTGGA